MIHHPKSCSCRLLNNASTRGFVNISASCSIVAIHLIWMSPLWMCSWKWWYLIAMCQVHSHIFGAFTNSMHPMLSLKIVECVTTFPIFRFVMPAISFSTVHIGIILCIACNRVIYSASAIDSVISVCNLDTHSTGQLANTIAYPVLDFTVLGLSESAMTHIPAKLAST